MKFYVVVNYYLVGLSFKFHEDPCINARTRVIKAQTRDKTSVHLFATHVRASMHESSWNLKLKPTRLVIDHHIKDPSFRYISWTKWGFCLGLTEKKIWAFYLPLCYDASQKELNKAFEGLGRCDNVEAERVIFKYAKWQKLQTRNCGNRKDQRPYMWQHVYSKDMMIWGPLLNLLNE